MIKILEHPALPLPERDRARYLNVVSSMALVDGRAAGPELSLIRRLGKALQLPEAKVQVEIDALEKGRIAAPVTREALVTFREQPAIRQCLMMDSLAIAFADGALEPTESKQLISLATALRYEPDDVISMARFVERALFKRGAADGKDLAESFAGTLAAAVAPGGWLHR